MSQSLFINPSAIEAGLESAFLTRSKTNEAQAAAFDRFAKLGFPNRKVEGWKWSDFNAAMRRLDPAQETAAERAITPSLFAALNPIEFQIVNGRILLPEETVEGFGCGVLEPVAADPEFDNHAMAALNVALTRKALAFRTHKGVNLERPVLVRHINSCPAPIFSQVLARAEEGSRLTVIETFEGTCALYSTLIHMGVRDGACLDRYVLQDARADSVTHALFGGVVGAGARFRQASLSTGGRLARHETHVLAPSDSAFIKIDSAALVSGERHSDFTSQVRFIAESCQTRQLHKGVAKERGRNVFQGKFHVERSAQKTDAKMTANALLLSDMAEANHKPELEIFADDVECAHGSAVGALDEDALFYLRQRGLSELEARAVLVEAFVGEAIDGVENELIRDVLNARVKRWLEDA